MYLLSLLFWCWQYYMDVLLALFPLPPGHLCVSYRARLKYSGELQGRVYGLCESFRASVTEHQIEETRTSPQNDVSAALYSNDRPVSGSRVSDFWMSNVHNNIAIPIHRVRSANGMPGHTVFDSRRQVKECHGRLGGKAESTYRDVQIRMRSSRN